MCVWKHAHVSIVAHGDQKRILNLQVLAVWVIVDHPIRVLGTEPYVLLKRLLTLSLTSIHFPQTKTSSGLETAKARSKGWWWCGVCYMTYKDKNGLNYLRKKIIIELSKLWVMTNTE